MMRGNGKSKILRLLLRSQKPARPCIQTDDHAAICHYLRSHLGYYEETCEDNDRGRVSDVGQNGGGRGRMRLFVRKAFSRLGRVNAPSWRALSMADRRRIGE